MPHTHATIKAREGYSDSPGLTLRLTLHNTLQELMMLVMMCPVPDPIAERILFSAAMSIISLDLDGMRDELPLVEWATEVFKEYQIRATHEVVLNTETPE